ncbi:MAG: MFS transporter [Bacillota bacterium]
MPNNNFRLWSKDFILICLANFFYFGSFYFLIPTLPQYVDLLGGTPAEVGLVMGLFTMASVIIRPYFGKMADRQGRKIFMLVGSSFFILFPLVYNMIQAITPLYLVRVLNGLAHASFLVGAMAYIADLAPPHRRGEVIGIFSTANVIAMALFPAWGIAIIKEPEDFTHLFIVSAFTAAAGFLAVALLRDIRPRNDKNIKNMGFFAIGKKRGVLVPSLTLFAGATAYGALVTFLPLFAPQRGLPDFGIFFTVYAGSTILSRALAGALSDRIGRYRVILPFTLILIIAVGLLPSLSNMWLLIIIAALYGLGFGAFMPALNALVVDHTPPQERGSALAFFTSFMDIGITAGAMVLGLVGSRAGYSAMFYTAAAVVTAGLIYFAVFMKPDRRESTAADQKGEA